MSSAGIAARPAARLAGRLQTVAVLAVTAVLIGAAAWFIEQPTGDGGYATVQLTGDTTGPVVRAGDDERERRVESSPVDAPVVALQHVLDHRVACEQNGSRHSNRAYEK